MKLTLVIFLMLGFQLFGQLDTLTLHDSIVSIAKEQLGTPYKYATSNPGVSFDCSGFTDYVYKSVNLDHSRSSKAYGQLGEKVDIETAQIGDCILFTGTQPGSKSIGHVGIVVQNDDDGLFFIHCSSSKKHFGVVITDYYNSNYVKRFHSVRRLH